MPNKLKFTYHSTKNAPLTVNATELNAREAFFRGAKKAFKIVFIIFLGSLPLGFIEPFLYLFWGSTLLGILVFVVGPLLHFKYANERISFQSATGKCPTCQKKTSLKPFMSTQLRDEITVLCPLCGDTALLSKSHP